MYAHLLDGLLEHLHRFDLLLNPQLRELQIVIHLDGSVEHGARQNSPLSLDGEAVVDSKVERTLRGAFWNLDAGR